MGLGFGGLHVKSIFSYCNLQPDVVLLMWQNVVKLHQA